MTTEKITATVQEFWNVNLKREKLPAYSVLIKGQEYKAGTMRKTDKPDVWEVDLLDTWEGKNSVKLKSTHKVIYEAQKEKVEPAKTNKVDKTEGSAKIEPKTSKVDKDFSVDFLINSELIDRLVASNDSEMLGKIAKLQAEFLKLQKDLCDRLMADDTAQSDKAEVKPKSDRVATDDIDKPQAGLTFNEKLDRLKKAYTYIETAKNAGNKINVALLEAKEKFYWANGENVVTGKDRFNNMINGYRFTKELYGDRKGDMHRRIIDSGLSFNEWYNYCTKAELKPKAEKTFFG